MSEQCYCKERQRNPELDAILRADGIPEGYCGRCCACGEFGHTRAHPHQPITSAWCDDHWQEVLESSALSLPQWLILLLLVIIVLALIVW